MSQGAVATIPAQKTAKPQRRAVVGKKRKENTLAFGHFEQARLKALAEFDDL